MDVGVYLKVGFGVGCTSPGGKMTGVKLVDILQ